MADASQELMLRVRGDNSGADKAIAQTTRSLNGLKVSGEKAGGAFRNFSRTLSEAKTGADVAAGAADSLTNIIGKSLVGAVAVGAVKLFTDQINKMSESVKESALAASKAFDDIEKAGASMSLGEAQSQVKGLETNIVSLQTKLNELDKSPFQNFIAKTTGARESLEELQASQSRLRDTELAAGLMSQNISEARMVGLNEEEKALEKINQEYRDRDKIAATMTDKSAQAQFQSESGDKFARDRNAELDKQAKAQKDKQQAYNDEVFRAEIQANIYERKFKENADKEAADRQKADQESAHKEELYNIAEAAKMEEDADNTRFQRLIRDANRARQEQKKTQEEAKKAEGLTGGLLGASRAGQQALGSARKRTERENKQANFKTQEAVFGRMQEEENKARAARGQGPITMQAIKEREASKQAAREAPSLANQIQGQATGVDPSQIASQQAQSRFEKQSMGMTSDLGPRTKVGVEAQSQTGDVMKAITSLVDLMKSATLVN
jgi:hypothetical protein